MAVDPRFSAEIGGGFGVGSDNTGLPGHSGTAAVTPRGSVLVNQPSAMTLDHRNSTNPTGPGLSSFTKNPKQNFRDFLNKNGSCIYKNEWNKGFFLNR